jgi:hypothetical protein
MGWTGAGRRGAAHQLNPEVYSRDNAETAWKRTVDFLHAKRG